MHTLSTIGLLLFAATYVYLYREELAVIFTISWEAIGILIGAGFLRRLADSARFAALYKALGAYMGIWESFGLSQVAGALNLILPANAGSGARAVHLKQKYGVPYSQAPAIFLGSYVFSLSIGAVLMILSNIAAVLTGQYVPLILWVGAAAASASFLLFWLYIPPQLTTRLGRVGRMLQLFSDGWKSLRTQRRILLEISFFQLLTFLGSGLVITVAYQVLGLELDFLIGISIAVFTTVSNTISIVPGNFGVQEAVIATLSQFIGISFWEGIAAAALIRATGLIITFAVAPIAWYFLFARRGHSISITDLR